MGSKGASHDTATSSSAPPPEVMQNYRDITAQAKQVAAAPLQQYQGNIVAPFSDMQNKAFGNINDAQGAYLPYFGQSQGLIGQGTQAYNPTAFSADAISKYENPYAQDVINSTLANSDIEDAKQQSMLQGNAVARGAWGGDRADLARNDLARNQSLARNQTIAGLENQNYSQALNQFNTANQAGLQSAALNNQSSLQGAGLLGALGNNAQANDLNAANTQLGAGTLQQQLDQAKLNVPYQQFLQQQQYPFQTTQWLSSLLTGLGSQMGGTSTTTQPGPSQFSQNLGTAAGLAGTAAMIFSDEKVKENIHRVGKLDNGLPVYSYNYKGDNATQIGLIAQDVEKKNPDAVREVNGIKAVDYLDAVKGEDGKYALGGIANQGQQFGIPDESFSFIPQSAFTPMASSIPKSPVVGAAKDPMADSTALISAIGKMKDSDPSPIGSGLSLFMHGLGQGSGIKESAGYGLNGAGFGNQAYDLLDTAANGGRIEKYPTGGIVAPPSLTQMSSLDSADYLSPNFGLKPSDILRQPVVADAGMTPSMAPMPGFGDSAVPAPSGSLAGIAPAAGGGIPDAPVVDTGLAAAPANNGVQSMSDLEKELQGNEPEISPAMALAQAGFGMAASRSPHLSQAIAEGAQAGLKNYADQKANLRDYKMKELAARKEAERLGIESDRYKKMLDIEQQNADTNKAYKDIMGNASKQNADTKEKALGADFSGMFKHPETATDETISGKSVLDDIKDPSKKSMYEAVLNGTADLKDFSLKQSDRANAAAVLHRIDSNFDEHNYGNVTAALKAYNANGNIGKVNNSYNTVIQHAQEGIEQAKALNNEDWWTGANSIANAIATHTGDPRVKVLDSTLTNIATEMAKALNPTGVATIPAIEEQRANLLAKIDSPAQITAVLKNLAVLGRDKISTNQQQYLNDIGDSDFRRQKADEFFQPNARKILSSMGVPIQNMAGGSSTVAAQQAPSPDILKEYPNAKIAPNGKYYIPNPAKAGKWLEVVP